MNKIFLKAGFVGIAVLVLSTVLILVNPSKAVIMPKGFTTPIVAFEFIASEQEVLALFGAAGTQRDALIQKIDLGNKIDFAYMLTYSFFLWLFSFICFKDTKKKWFIVPMIISAVVLGADALENIQLLSITAKIAEGKYSVELARLHVFTWIKWAGIGAVFVSLIPFLWKKGIFGKIISDMSILAAGIAIAAYFNRSVFNEIYALCVGLVFTMLIIFSLFYKKKSV